MDVSEFLNDPVQPKVSTIIPNASLIEIKKIPFDDLQDKVTPCIQYLFSMKSQISCIKCFPHSENFAAGSCNALHVMTSEEVKATTFYSDLPFHFIRTIDIHPTEMMIAISSEGSSVRIVSTISGSSILHYHAHSSPATKVLFAPSMKRVVSTSLDGTIAIYDLRKEKIAFSFDLMKGKKSITTAAIKDDESYLAVGFNDGTLGIFDPRMENGMIEISSNKGWINSLSFHPILNTLASGGSDNSIVLWDVRNTERSLGSFTENESSVIATSLSNNELWGMSRDGVLKIWDTDTQIMKNSYNISKFGLTACDMNPSERKVFFSEKSMVIGMLEI